MMHYYGTGYLWMGFCLIFMLLFWTAIILLIIWLYKQVKGPSEEQKAETTLEILKKRYARGEIGKDEFEDMKKDLEE